MKYARGWIERFIADYPISRRQSELQNFKENHDAFTLAITHCRRQQLGQYACSDDDRVILTLDNGVPTRATESKNILRALIEHIGIFGAPQRLRTDNGSSLTSQQVRDVLALLGTEHKLTVAYSHEENGLVENANRKVVAHLREMVFDASV